MEEVSKAGEGGGTLLCFSVSMAKNWGRAGRLGTMWKSKYRPILIVILLWQHPPPDPLPPVLIWKWSVFRLKNPKGGPFYVKKILISDFHETWNLILLWPKNSTHEIWEKSEMNIFLTWKGTPFGFFTKLKHFTKKLSKTQSKLKWPLVLFLDIKRKF